MEDDDQNSEQHRKRKSKGFGGTQTPDLNIPLAGCTALVPSGLVSSWVSQMDGGSENSGGSMIETLKKQKRGNITLNARLAAATRDSPRWAQ